jgi:hypothetical protein
VFNFSANHLILLSRMEYRTCVVLVMRDDSTRRVYCVSGKVNSADKLYLVVESVKPDTKHNAASTVPVHADGAGGRPMR